MSVPVSFSRLCLLGWFLVTAILVTGCGSKPGEVAPGRTKPKGRILENGLPIKVDTARLPPGDPGLQITFISVGGVNAGEEHQAVITDAAEGKFELAGADGKGIEPGKYRIVVTMAPVGSADLLKGKYSREKSKIEVDLKPGEDLVIDIGNYK